MQLFNIVGEFEGIDGISDPSKCIEKLKECKERCKEPWLSDSIIQGYKGKVVFVNSLTPKRSREKR